MHLRNVKDFASRHIFKQYGKFRMFLRILKILLVQSLKSVFFHETFVSSKCVLNNEINTLYTGTLL